MAFLSKGKKIDLYNLALELRVDVTSDDKIIDLRDKIIQCVSFKEDSQFVKDIFNNIVDERKKLEDAENKRIEIEEIQLKEMAEVKRLAEERAFELEKLKLQTQNRDIATAHPATIDSHPMRLDLKTVLPTFVPDKDDMSLFLTMFERQMKILNVSADFWVSHLIGILPSDIGKLVAREPEEMFKNYSHIRAILLQRFKLTAERFRVLFSRHQKRDNSTWKDYFFELRTYLEGWLAELEVNSFELLKELIIADQIKKKCPPEYRSHYLDGWEKLNDPVLLAEKLDLYENMTPPYQKFPNLTRQRETQKPSPKITSNQEFRKYPYSKVENRNVSTSYKRTFPIL